MVRVSPSALQAISARDCLRRVFGKAVNLEDTPLRNTVEAFIARFVGTHCSC